MVKGTVKYPAAKGFRVKHSSYEWLEFNISMVKFWRYRTLELDLIGLKATTTIRKPFL